MWKKYCCLLVSIIMLFTFAGCEKKKEEIIQDDGVVTTNYQGMTIVEEVGMKNVFNTKSVELSKNYFFTYYVNVPNINFYDRIFVLNDRIYFTVRITSKKRDDGYINPEIALHSFDFNGENENFLPSVSVNDNAPVRFMWLDSQYNQITIEELDYVFILNKISESGDVIFSMKLYEIFDGKEILSMVVGKDDNIYVGSEKKIAVFDKDGKTICEIEHEDSLINFVSAFDKIPIVKTKSSDYTIKYRHINMEDQSLDDIELPVPANIAPSVNNNIFYGEGYDYYYSNSIGVYGYDIASNTMTKVLDWLNSDMTISDMKSFIVVSPEKMGMIWYDYTQAPLFSVLDKIPDDEIPEKEYISIGCIYPTNEFGIDHDYINILIMDFNRNNDKYRATLTNYYSSFENMDSVLRLNTNIAAGNTPDILYINEEIPFMSYANKDMFLDINEYLKEDAQLSDNLLPFVKTPAEIGGKLLMITTKFQLYTLMGKTNNISDITSWSYRDVINTYKSLPEGVEFVYATSRDIFKHYTLDSAIAECIDYENASCNFDQQGMRDYLEFLKLLPVRSKYVTNYNSVESYVRARNNETFLSGTLTSNVSIYNDFKALNFRDEAAEVIGFPTFDGKTSNIHITAEGFSIINSSENKEGAWEFIKHSLSDGFAKYSINIFSMIPTYSGVNVCNEIYNKTEYAYRDDFEWQAVIPNDGTYPGILVTIDDAVINEYNEYIGSINNYTRKDTDVYNIFDEELSVFLNTDKSIDDTIKAIQSRVSIYMSEMWG